MLNPWSGVLALARKRGRTTTGQGPCLIGGRGRGVNGPARRTAWTLNCRSNRAEAAELLRHEQQHYRHRTRSTLPQHFTIDKGEFLHEPELNFERNSVPDI
ncbi:hypothetical protein J6590_039705 [Homalodisca vitripennis]|nr:hypothetical protein J6590_039705 [Homalodisca vitripennis]